MSSRIYESPEMWSDWRVRPSKVRPPGGEPISKQESVQLKLEMFKLDTEILP